MEDRFYALTGRVYVYDESDWFGSQQTKHPIDTNLDPQMSPRCNLNEYQTQVNRVSFYPANGGFHTNNVGGPHTNNGPYPVHHPNQSFATGNVSQLESSSANREPLDGGPRPLMENLVCNPAQTQAINILQNLLSLMVTPFGGQSVQQELCP